MDQSNISDPLSTSTWPRTRCHPAGGREHAAKTIQGYVQDISIFLRWWQGTFGEELTIESLQADPFRLNRKTLQDFLAWLQTTQGYSASTVLRYAASLRAFCQFLIGIEGSFSTIRRWGYDCRSGRPRNRRGWTMPSVSRFEAAFQSPWVDKVTKRKRTYETQAGVRLIRDKAIAFLMLYAGPRVEEVERLNSGGCRAAPQIRGAAHPPGQGLQGAGCPAAEAGP